MHLACYRLLSVLHDTAVLLTCRLPLNEPSSRGPPDAGIHPAARSLARAVKHNGEASFASSVIRSGPLHQPSFFTEDDANERLRRLRNTFPAPSTRLRVPVADERDRELSQVCALWHERLGEHECSG